MKIEGKILNIKKVLLDFSNAYLQLITSIQSDVDYLKMDILANYYKSSIFCLKSFLNEPNSNNAKSSKNKINRLYKEVLFLRFSIEKNDDQFELFKKNTLTLIEEISKFE